MPRGASPPESAARKRSSGSLAASRYRGVAAADPAPPIEAGLAALKDQYNAKVGFYGLNLSSNRILGYRENDIFATCSAFKAYVAAQILQKGVDVELIGQASPITEPNIGGWMTLSDLCAAAVRQSDNTAARFVPVAHQSVLDEPHRAQLQEWMRTSVTGDTRIRAGLPPGWSIADKTGAGDYASTNDIGLAFGPNGERVLLAVMTRTRSDDPQASRPDALIADVTRLTVPWLLA